jgi:hypothetical protein
MSAYVAGAEYTTSARISRDVTVILDDVGSAETRHGTAMAARDMRGAKMAVMRFMSTHIGVGAKKHKDGVDMGVPAGCSVGLDTVK